MFTIEPSSHLPIISHRRFEMATAPERPIALRPIQEGAFMCRKCDEIAEAIVRYRRLKGQVTDQQMIEATVLLLDKLEAEKLALHPKE